MAPRARHRLQSRRSRTSNHRKWPMPTYWEYLKLDELLELQQRLGEEHDEMLFIVIHQSYELWFKEMLHEIDYMQQLMEKADVPRVSHTFKRILTVLKICLLYTSPSPRDS